ncbi:POPLD-domain-containing protein [Nadsonia fulvescens var. elongata DSM 6958]|uniref:POPLD-domain-containing protein n=1 Tax=Nadsonia fulvescens var. elongata DSM 6958 TaxID=857566 RepID=A0A1E3PHH7_9ASCO|nr:POPLD-domain-containing protein [Nadsonia fulvescens var. elongata DSM 6958]
MSTPRTDGRQRKRAKLNDARSILVQNSERSLADNRHLMVPEFVQSRQYEIQQLENAMIKSRNSSKKRAFQLVPRVLRRRAASHNIKRVPKRLRSRARKEMKDDNTPPKDKFARARAKRGHSRAIEMAKEQAHQRLRNRPILQLSSADATAVNSLARPPLGKLRFRGRQKKKTWLPTHVWHAKRAHIETKWGFSVPTAPTLKCYRPTHKADNVEGAVVWDTSYYSTFVIQNSESISSVENVLSSLTESETSKPKFLSGTKCWEGLLTDPDLKPSSKILGPGLIYYSPLQLAKTAKQYSAIVRFHPSILTTMVPLIQRLCKQFGASYYDCRYSIGSIDISGPKSITALSMIIKLAKPADGDADTEFKLAKERLWSNLTRLSNTASLPTSVVFGFNNVIDPRLSYPPRRPSPKKPMTSDELVDVIVDWNKDKVASGFENNLFTMDGRTASYKNQATIKAINRRRTNAGPGKKLVHNTNKDPLIPIVLIKRLNNSWTLLTPWNWVLPFWFSLNHIPHIKLGGLKQKHQLSFEKTRLFFPDDYPTTDSGWKCEHEKSTQRREQWFKRPKGKRVAYHKVITAEGVGEIGDPFKCDWTTLALIKHRKASALKNHKNTQDSISSNSQDANFINSHLNLQTAKNSPENIPSRSVYYIRKNILDLTNDYETESTDSDHNVCIDTDKVESEVPQLPLIPVKIKYLHRGVPKSQARIYCVPKTKANKWKTLLTQSPNNHADETNHEYPSCPSSDYLAGFVTTGEFNLKEGNGVAVGWLSAEDCLAEGDTDESLPKRISKEGICIVRNIGSSVGRLAKWERIL